MEVDDFLQEQGIEWVDVLHADIQDAEFEMLCDAEKSLSAGRIGTVFAGTHGQDLRYRCKESLENHGYTAIADADFEHGTYCQDGVLVARLSSMARVEPIDLPLRQPHRPYTIGDNTYDLYTILA